ncbi:MAG: glycosyltransferase, partial [Ruminococcus sp.]|nr:glycosyltransferase [Ruminococcus sp.]
MEKSKISIIVPVYNTERYLERCIKSIIAQTYKNLEIIAVNDGSTDNSRKILEELSADDDRIVIVDHPKNKGLYHARITGVENASGDYIGFVDSDDYVSCDYYRTLIEKAVETDSDIVVGKTVHEDEKGYRWIHNMYHFINFGTLEGDEVVSEYWKQEGRNFIWHTIWNKLYNKRIWDKAMPILKKQGKHLIMTEDFAFSSV